MKDYKTKMIIKTADSLADEIALNSKRRRNKIEIMLDDEDLVKIDDEDLVKIIDHLVEENN